MPADVEIRPYEAGEEAGVLAVWNEAMWADPIDALGWRSRYLLDPNFSATECPIAVDSVSGDIVGFVLGFTEKNGEPTERTARRDAWVVGFGVRQSYRRQGIATALMQSVVDQWKQSGIGRVQFGPYVPGYVTPGVDVAAYAGAIAFLDAFGATELYRPLSMKASLTGYRPEPNVEHVEEHLAGAGITVRAAGPADILPLLEFLDEHFSHWRVDATPVLHDLLAGDPRLVTLLVAEDKGQIIGYAQARNERFGPFGVNEAYRGRGIGAVLLSRTLRAMRTNGFHCAWFLWTSDRAAKLYRHHGFEEVRRFSLMAKELAS